MKKSDHLEEYLITCLRWLTKYTWYSFTCLRWLTKYTWYTFTIILYYSYPV